MDESHGLKTHLRKKNARVGIAINVIVRVVKCFNQATDVISGDKRGEIF
jgi:hypothetical protein